MKKLIVVAVLLFGIANYAQEKNTHPKKAEMEQMTPAQRKEFKDLVESLGGTVCGSISKKTTLILLGENAGPNKIEAIDNLKSSQNFKIFTNENIQEFFDLIKK